jgi:N-acetylneuraminate synthase
MADLRIGGRQVGDAEPCYIIGEIGINHNGDLEIAKKLIDLAAHTGCDAVKFQKRTPEVCVPKDQWNIVRDTPWGTMTYIDYKHRIEFGEKEYGEIDHHCREVGIAWFASCWDEPSVDFIDRFGPPCYKIASACLTDDSLLKYTRAKGRPIVLSTGMSTLAQVDHAVDVLGKRDLAILHACSAYPASYADLNLNVIPALRERFRVPVGYSGHESGIASSVAAVALGARIVERHITVDRAMWGTDQAASLGPSGLERLIRDIRIVEVAMGAADKRLLDSEVSIMKKLRRVG